jgi:hypothetical protein
MCTGSRSPSAAAATTPPAGGTDMRASRYPQHRNGSGGVAGWLTGLVLGAVILYYWHPVVVIFSIGAILAIAGLAVLLSWRKRRLPPWVLPVPAHIAAQRYTAETVIKERRRGTEYAPPAVEAVPVAELHQHVHLHGLDAGQLAGLAALLQQRHGVVDGRKQAPAITMRQAPLCGTTAEHAAIEN